MREYLFRGKCCGEWIEGSLIHAGSYVCILQDESKVHPMDFPYLDAECGIIVGKAEPVDPETVGQFTGLYDSTKWEDLTDAEKLDFYHQHYIGEDGMSVRFQHIDDVKFLWKGKKIFEGDILHFLSAYQESYMGKCVVRYGKFNCSCCDGVFGWYLDGGDIRDLEGNSIIKYEICGNIHDQPELLEGESNG